MILNNPNNQWVSFYNYEDDVENLLRIEDVECINRGVDLERYVVSFNSGGHSSSFEFTNITDVLDALMFKDVDGKTHPTNEWVIIEHDRPYDVLVVRKKDIYSVRRTPIKNGRGGIAVNWKAGTVYTNTMQAITSQLTNDRVEF